MTVKVIDRTAAKWKHVATSLHFEGYDIDTIAADEHQSKDGCHSTFSKWLEGKGRQPTSWETVISALNEAGFGELARELSDVLDD